MKMLENKLYAYTHLRKPWAFYVIMDIYWLLILIPLVIIYRVYRRWHHRITLRRRFLHQINREAWRRQNTIRIFPPNINSHVVERNYVYTNSPIRQRELRINSVLENQPTTPESLPDLSTESGISEETNISMGEGLVVFMLEKNIFGDLGKFLIV